MVQCAKCGMQNVDGGKFCRFCGDALLQSSAGSGGDLHQPYSWQSAEYPASDKTQGFQGKPTQVFSPPPPNYQQPSQQMGYPTVQAATPVPIYGQHSQPIAYGHAYCNHCRMQVIPAIKRQISQAGWIIAAILLFTTFIFFWIGLCIREDASICPHCRNRIW